jgi:catechol 2,3-dioxygenase-like lactoylglutathione lyase family enzyme
MKRFHVHVSVDDLAQSTRFYSALFGALPAVEKPDYAKWMLDDPRINFAISKRGHEPGINHLGLQTDSENELDVMRINHAAAELALDHEGATSCCYAKSTKHWLADPQGVVWEMYHTMAEAKTYMGEKEADSTTACCAPASAAFAKPASTQAGEEGKSSCGTSCAV